MAGITLAAIQNATGASDATGRPVGGGILDAGLMAEYFGNPDLVGEPAYRRRDVRVNFDWGELLPVIGSRAESLRSFPRDGFSARWSGQIFERDKLRFLLYHTDVRDDDLAMIWLDGVGVVWLGKGVEDRQIPRDAVERACLRAYGPIHVHFQHPSASDSHNEQEPAPSTIHVGHDRAGQREQRASTEV
jgi:hypothetical protein